MSTSPASASIKGTTRSVSSASLTGSAKGGESSRPFAQPVSEADETDRVVPLIQALAPEVDIPVSIDTVKAQVARQPLKAVA
ncbi:MAG: dihydropteroate synthase, partial [Desulfobacteraceae bacterium]